MINADDASRKSLHVPVLLGQLAAALLVWQQSDANAEGFTVDLKDRGFVCVFPEKPERMKLKDVLSFEHSESIHRYVVTQFLEVDTPKDVDKTLIGQRDHIVKKLGGVLLEASPVSWQGWRGERFCFIHPHEKFPTAYRHSWMIHVYAEGKMYRLAYGMTGFDKSDKGVDMGLSTSLGKFLEFAEGFTLTGKGRTAPSIPQKIDGAWVIAKANKAASEQGFYRGEELVFWEGKFARRSTGPLGGLSIFKGTYSAAGNMQLRIAVNVDGDYGDEVNGTYLVQWSPQEEEVVMTVSGGPKNIGGGEVRLRRPGKPLPK